MSITKAKTKTEAIKIALENIVQQERVSKLTAYHGKISLDIDLDALRKR